LAGEDVAVVAIYTYNPFCIQGGQASLGGDSQKSSQHIHIRGSGSMETVMRFLQEVLAFLVKIMSSSNELLVITVACILSIIGFIVLSKRALGSAFL